MSKQDLLERLYALIDAFEDELRQIVTELYPEMDEPEQDEEKGDEEGTEEQGNGEESELSD